MPGTVVIVDVGQGDCTIAVDGQTKQALLIDCNMDCQDIAVAELEELGYSELSAAVITHSHLDHFGGLLNAIDQLGPRFKGRLYYNHDALIAEHRRQGGTKDSESRISGLLRRATQLDEEGSRAQPDIGPQSLGSMTWSVLAPSHNQLSKAIVARNPNLASVIVLIESEDRSVIIGSDAQLEAWESLYENLPDKPIVRWPHHGGSIAGSHETLFRLLDPSAVLVSVGANNSYNHPSEDFFASAAQHDSPLICTQATRKCDPDNGGQNCAGTIRIRLESEGEPLIEPGRGDHAEFIQQLGSARCLDRGQASPNGG
ncbi:ComEC/Rec2 family competence protein [Candidatus Poriferisocius sp.]|uniref:ComEC/Rec2 family competence protein n=1 Tax=Candidatus Poriferisocius sp. TaxID=3101276 RepID=UPI003B01F940